MALTHHLISLQKETYCSVSLAHLEEVRTKRGKEKTLEYSHSRISSRISSTGLGNGTVLA